MLDENGGLTKLYPTNLLLSLLSKSAKNGLALNASKIRFYGGHSPEIDFHDKNTFKRPHIRPTLA